MDNTMRELLGRAENLSGREKRIWEDVFQALGAEQEQLLGAIRGEVREALGSTKPQKAPWRTVTALIKEKDAEQAEADGFFPVIRNGFQIHRQRMTWTAPEDFKPWRDELPACRSAGTAFLRCRYSDMQALLQKTYEAKVTAGNGTSYTVPYRLVFTPQLLEQEEPAERTAIQYGITCPPLYAPMSRRAVLVCLNLEGHITPRPEPMEIDFQYAANGLKGVLLDGRLPVWNIEMAEQPRPRETTEKLTPFQDCTSRIYEFNLRENEFILTEGGSLGQKRMGDKVYAVIDSGERISQLTFTRLTLHSVPDKLPRYMDEMFCSSFETERIWKERIRTQADIVAVTERFEPAGLHLTASRQRPGDRRSVAVYDHSRAYHYPKNTRLRGSGTCCYLEWERPSDDLYFEDLVSWASAYMNYFYPEFHWVGIE